MPHINISYSNKHNFKNEIAQTPPAAPTEIPLCSENTLQKVDFIHSHELTNGGVKTRMGEKIHTFMDVQN
jgi:hypothetical protein